eukprot:CAMPEP_0115831560 /NCGR_PEP_ID=MMETSP0287-20121206/2203_1 /TAXON_ID=412157 /ORGANISM="Chrysochromulina rotalis, Strain UIO044" /LENGTH=46 /DNA_ID= /DNA_START= /DNA_END= /DNA_ORIENTATION=
MTTGRVKVHGTRRSKGAQTRASAGGERIAGEESGEGIPGVPNAALV